jgi:phosphatidylglycerophosphate synthase
MSLLAEYKASLRNITIEEYVDLIIFRPLAFLFVKSIYRTDITPNRITLISMLTGIFSGVMFAIGGSTSMIVGGLLLGLATIFDCADGQLARLKNNGTAFGRILDGVVDYIYTVAAFVGIAIGGRNGLMEPVLW